MKIRTFSDLTIARAQYGVTDIKIEISETEFIWPVHATLLTPDRSVQGRGATEQEALDDAFFRLVMLIGHEIQSAHAGAA